MRILDFKTDMDKLTLYISIGLVIFISSVCGKGGFYGYKVTNLRGKRVSLEKYRGKVSLVVNLASECGYTDEHYTQLAAIHTELAEKKHEPFTVLGFPCNQFGEQEPHSHEDIEIFARQTYKATFPIFGKMEVADRKADPAYRFLAESAGGEEPKWNFWKYLVDGEGRVLNSWGPKVNVENIRPDILKAIENLKAGHQEL